MEMDFCPLLFCVNFCPIFSDCIIFPFGAVTSPSLWIRKIIKPDWISSLTAFRVPPSSFFSIWNFRGDIETKIYDSDKLHNNSKINTERKLVIVHCKLKYVCLKNLVTKPLKDGYICTWFFYISGPPVTTRSGLAFTILKCVSVGGQSSCFSLVTRSFHMQFEFRTTELLRKEKSWVIQ